MKNLISICVALLMSSSVAFADTGRVICKDEMMPDGNTYGGLEMALKKLNTELVKISAKTVSTPVFLSAATPIIVCVTITQ